jgi:hypothetical protein
MLAVLDTLARLTLRERKLSFGSVALHTMKHSVKCVVKQLQLAHVSHFVQAYVPLLLAQAQSEGTRYSVGLSGGGTV